MTSQTPQQLRASWSTHRGLSAPAPRDPVETLRTLLVVDLGHDRVFSLDNHASMLKRVARVRELPHVAG